MKSPTEVAVEPTLVLAPLELKRSYSRSGNGEPVGVLVKKLKTYPLSTFTVGVNSQLLRSAPDGAISKFVAMYAVGAPAWAGKIALLPWNQADDGPAGTLLLI